MEKQKLKIVNTILGNQHLFNIPSYHLSVLHRTSVNLSVVGIKQERKYH